VARMWERRVSYKVLVGETRNRPFGRPKRRWLDNIKMDLQEVRWGMDWIYLAQDTVM